MGYDLLREEAIKKARSLNIPRSCFKASKGWAIRFMRRMGLALRLRKTISQKLPKDFEHKLLNYQRHITNLNSSIERVGEFKYLGTTLTNKNSIQEEIMSRLKLGNACYYSVQNLLSSSSLSKKLKIKIYRTIILPVVLYGCETWSLTLREERRLRVFETRVLRRVFGLRGTR